MKKTLFIGLCLLGGWSAALPAAATMLPGAEQLTKDFAPFAATVAATRAGGEILLSVGRRQGVAEGDLFTPFSATVSQTTDELVEPPACLLVVEQVATESSRAKLSGTCPATEGSVWHRFAGIETSYVDAEDESPQRYRQLQELLPHLRWKRAVRPPETAAATTLIFIRQGESLVVKNGAGLVLSAYGVVRAESESKIAQALSPRDIVRLPGEMVGVAAGDFRGTGSTQLALLFVDRLEVGVWQKGGFQRTATFAFSWRGRVLGLDSADLDGDGRAELYVTAVHNDRLQAQVIDLKADGLQPRKERLPWLLRGMQGSARRALLAQPAAFFQAELPREAFMLRSEAGRIVPDGKVALPVPGLYGFLPFITAKQERLAALLSEQGQLMVAGADGEILWSCDGSFGGRRDYLELRDHDNILFSYLLARMESDANGMIVLPANTGSRIISGYRRYTSGVLYGMHWDGVSLVPRWQTQPLDGYLADFVLADIDNDGALDRVTAWQFSPSSWSKKGVSALVIY